jgi:hypothetical protein
MCSCARIEMLDDQGELCQGFEVGRAQLRNPPFQTLQGCICSIRKEEDR